MKSKSTFVVLTAMLLGLSNYSMAQDPTYFEDYKTMDIYKTDAEITIDGVDNEDIWSSSDVIEQTADRILANNPGEGENPTGYALSYKAVYDNDYLYLFIKVKDNTYIPYDKEQMTGDTNVDNIELYFSPIDERGSADVSYLPGLKPDLSESQLRISVGSDSYASGTGYVKENIIDGKISGYKYVTKQVEGGYNVEVMLSWDIVISDDYYDDKLVEGQKIFFDLEGADCVDYANGRKVILGWSGDDFFAWKRNSKYGEMNFKGMAATSISTKEIAEIKYLFANDELTLTGVDINTDVTIYDLSGRKVATTNYRGTPINLGNLISGVYLVPVKDAENFKIIK